MANDKDIKIGLSIAGADAAAADINKVPEALNEIPAAIDDVSDALGEQGDEFGQATEAAQRHSAQLDEISKASRTLVAIQTVEMLKKTTSALREATAEGGLLHDQLGDLGPALDTVDNGLDMMSAGLSAAVATGNPVIGVLAGIAAGIVGVTDAYKEMRAQLDTEDAKKKQADEMEQKRLDAIEFRKRNLSLITQVEGIGAENEALAEQEDSLKRMIQLRERLSGQANTAARQEVQLAKLKGGDVALAEANVIATELQGALQGLNDKMVAAKQDAFTATQQEISTNKAWQLAQEEVAAGLRDLWSEDTQEIKSAAEKAATEGQRERQKLTDFMTVSENSRQEILRSAEIALETKEKEYEGKTSAKAAAAFQGVFNSLVSEQQKGQETAQQAIASIQADAARVTAAAETKAQEVKTAMQTAATSAAQTVQGIGSQASQQATAVNQAVASAGNQVRESLDLLTEKVVTVLAQISATTIKNSNEIARQGAQINQLFARIR